MHLAIIGHKEDKDLDALQNDLEANSHTCSRLAPVIDTNQLFTDLEPDAVLLDLAVDALDADRILAFVTEAHRDTYVAIFGLVSRQEADVYDPSLGLDDFLVRPPRADELLSRIRQVRWRRKGPSEDEGQLLRRGDLVVHLDRYEVWVGGREVTLTFKEFELLRLLAANAGRVYTREVLLDRIWGYDYFGGTRTVDVHVRRLRSKLDDATHTFIETVRNVGYRFAGD